MTESEVRPDRRVENQLATRPGEIADVSALRGFLLGMLTLYLAACLFCVLTAGPGPGHEANWGPAFGMIVLAQLSLPGGFIFMFIILPLSRSGGLSKRTAGRVIGIEILAIVMCWIYALFLGGLD